MFIGEYSHTLDNKSRLIVPARFREELGMRFVMTKGMDSALFLYPMKEWEMIEGKLRNLSLTNREARAFVRLFFSGAAECEVDRQGRILVPQNLVEHAGLVRDAVVIGVLNRVEVWARERWEEYSSSQEMDYDQLADKLSVLDLNI